MSFRRAQTRTTSLLEATANVLVGYLFALLAQQLVFPLLLPSSGGQCGQE